MSSEAARRSEATPSAWRLPDGRLRSWVLVIAAIFGAGEAIILFETLAAYLLTYLALALWVLLIMYLVIRSWREHDSTLREKVYGIAAIAFFIFFVMLFVGQIALMPLVSAYLSRYLLLAVLVLLIMYLVIRNWRKHDSTLRGNVYAGAVLGGFMLFVIFSADSQEERFVILALTFWVLLTMFLEIRKKYVPMHATIDKAMDTAAAAAAKPYNHAAAIGCLLVLMSLAMLVSTCTFPALDNKYETERLAEQTVPPYEVAKEADSSCGRCYIELDGSSGSRSRSTLEIVIDPPLLPTRLERLAVMQHAAVYRWKQGGVDAVRVRLWAHSISGVAADQIVYAPDRCGWSGLPPCDGRAGAFWTELPDSCSWEWLEAYQVLDDPVREDCINNVWGHRVERNLPPLGGGLH